LEKGYEKALVHELRKNGLRVAQPHPILEYYDGIVVGDCYADLLVAETILVDLKAVQAS
jgi:GxxExxY protein